MLYIGNSIISTFVYLHGTVSNSYNRGEINTLFIHLWFWPWDLNVTPPVQFGNIFQRQKYIVKHYNNTIQFCLKDPWTLSKTPSSGPVVRRFAGNLRLLEDYTVLHHCDAPILGKDLLLRLVPPTSALPVFFLLFAGVSFLLLWLCLLPLLPHPMLHQSYLGFLLGMSFCLSMVRVLCLL